MPAEFQALLCPVATALRVTRPSPPATTVIDFENVGSHWSKTDAVVNKALPASNHLPYTTIILSECECGPSSTIAMSSK